MHNLASKLDNSSSLTQSVALEESYAPRIIQKASTIICCLVAVFLVWAYFSKLEEVAVADGQVIPSGYVQTIQHPEGGIVEEILVKEGDLVEKGSPLIRFDATNANADLGQMQERRSALEAEAARLKSFVGMSISDGDTMNAGQKEILRSMEDARENQRIVVRNQISQRKQEFQAAQTNLASLEKNISIKKEENNMLQEALKRGSSSKLAALNSARELIELEGRISEARSFVQQAMDAVREAESRLVSLDSDLKQDAMTKISTVEAELAEIRQSIARQEGAAYRTVLSAPVRGIVKGLSVNTIGAVVESGKVIMEIVPVEQELMVEALILPNDIGNIRPGQDVKVKISAFDYSRYGYIPGQVLTISASTFRSEDGVYFYKANVKLLQNYVGKNPSANLILPGMLVQADINTGTKTVLEYLFKPIQNITQNAFQER